MWRKMSVAGPFLCGFTVNPLKEMEFECYYLRVGKKDLTGKPRDSTKTNLMIRFNDKGVFIMKIHKKGHIPSPASS